MLRWHCCQHCLGLNPIAVLASLRTLPWRRCHHCCRGAGVILVLVLAHCHRCCHGAGVIVVVVLAPLPTPLGHCCHRGAGVIADVALALLPLLLSWRWRHRGPGLAFDVPADAERHPCCTRVTASITLASSPSLHPRHHQHCTGIFALVALALLLLSHWRCCPSRAHGPRRPYTQSTGRPSIVALCWHHCQRCLGLVTVAALVSLHTLPWGHCHRCRRDAGVIAVLALALLPTMLSRCWRPCGVALAPLPTSLGHELSPLLRWRHRRRPPGANFRGVPPLSSALAAPPGLCTAAPRSRAAALLEPGTAPLLPLQGTRRWASPRWPDSSVECLRCRPCLRIPLGSVRPPRGPERLPAWSWSQSPLHLCPREARGGRCGCWRLWEALIFIPFLPFCHGPSRVQLFDVTLPAKGRVDHAGELRCHS